MALDSPAAWREARSFHHSRFDDERLRAAPVRISVCLPARNCAATVGAIVGTLAAMREQDLIDEIVVIDGDSSDDTVRIAADAGARVHREAELKAEIGPVHGKGDAMWRALSVLEGDIICFIDADLDSFPAHYVKGLLGPLIELDEVEFVKAFYRRPFRVGEVAVADGGGRVNHLLARPALAIFYPELAGFDQPSPARSPHGARCSSEPRSRPATASRSRCCLMPMPRSASPGWPRSISTCAPTPTSRCWR